MINFVIIQYYHLVSIVFVMVMNVGSGGGGTVSGVAICCNTPNANL